MTAFLFHFGHHYEELTRIWKLVRVCVCVCVAFTVSSDMWIDALVEQRVQWIQTCPRREREQKYIIRLTTYAHIISTFFFLHLSNSKFYISWSCMQSDWIEHDVFLQRNANNKNCVFFPLLFFARSILFSSRECVCVCINCCSTFLFDSDVLLNADCRPYSLILSSTYFMVFWARMHLVVNLCNLFSFTRVMVL